MYSRPTEISHFVTFDRLKKKERKKKILIVQSCFANFVTVLLGTVCIQYILLQPDDSSINLVL